MIAAIRGHVVLHFRFYLAVAVGAATYVAAMPAASHIRLIAAGDAFFAAYLVAMAIQVARATPASMRRRASFEDEGIVLIIVVTLAMIGLSLWAIFAVLNGAAGADAWHVALLVANVPLGWFTLHTLAASHYAHVFYGDSGDGDRESHGESHLDFPGTEEPQASDFLYYAFTVGMTAQVSDVQVRSSLMRRLTLGHGIVSFFFNTVILALAINVAADLGR